MTTIEDNNVKIVNSLENKIQDLNTNNNELKERINKINKIEWKENITTHSHTNLNTISEHLNVINTKFTKENLHVKDVETCENVKVETYENFNCY